MFYNANLLSRNWTFPVTHSSIVPYSLFQNHKVVVATSRPSSRLSDNSFASVKK